MPTVEEVVLAYAQAWNERDPGRRRALIEFCWAPSGMLFAPQAQCVGRDALEADIAKFHHDMPGYRGILSSGLNVHNNFVRFSARILDPSNRTISEGTDIGEIDASGQLSKIVTFWGAPPPVDQTWPVDLIR